MPTNFKVQNREYILRGLVGFIETTAEVNSIGHYVAYCHRHDGTLEVYNELLTKSEKRCKTTNIVCRLVMYTE